MEREILDLLEEVESVEPRTKPLSVPVQQSFTERWRSVGELSKQAYGKNRLPELGCRSLHRLADMVEAAALKKLADRKEPA